MKKNLYQQLYIQVLFAVFCGIALGYYYPSLGIAMKPFSDGFIQLIKMMIAPVIFCTVVMGIVGMESMQKLGRIGGKALIYFEVVSTIALIVGLIVVNVLQPGAGMHVDVRHINPDEIASYAEAAKSQSAVHFFLNMIPTSIIEAFAKGDILQVLLISVLFGFSLALMPARGQWVIGLIEQVSHILFGMVAIIMRLAPLGALGAMAFTVGKYGVATLMPLLKFMGEFYLTCLLFIFFVLGMIARVNGFSIFRLIRYIKEELWIVLGTSSSESVLPRIITKLENLGCSKSIVGLVVPTGYSFNLDGTAIYLSMAALFVAQATDTSLTLVQQLTLLAILLLSSKGAAGVTGSGFITLAATLSVVPSVPIVGLTLIVGIDRFMSEARALTNLIGNSVATLVIARWEGELDQKQQFPPIP